MAALRLCTSHITSFSSSAHQRVPLERPLCRKNTKLPRPCHVCHASGDDTDAPSVNPRNSLELTIRRKTKQVEAVLKELGNEALEERLKNGVALPLQPPYRLARAISENSMTGRCLLAYELVRPSPSATSGDLVKLARSYVQLGAGAIVVAVDSEDTSEGLKDLFSVVQGVRVPVLARDWVIHPLQIVEAKEAGASGVIGIISQVNGRGTPVMSSFAAAIGLDAPVEVVNLREVEGLSKAGVVFYGINLGVGLSLSIPGFATDVAHGILGQLPFGAISMVGVRSIQEAQKARLSGADSLLIKRELIDEYKGNLGRLAELLDYATSGDD